MQGTEKPLVLHSERIQCILYDVNATNNRKNPATSVMSNMELTSGDALFKITAWLNTLASKSESGLNSPKALRTQQKSKWQPWNGHWLFLWAC